MLCRRGVAAAFVVSACIAVVGASASAESLAIKTGAWKKKIAIKTNGTAGQPLTLDVCFTKENLSLDKLLACEAPVAAPRSIT